MDKNIKEVPLCKIYKKKNLKPNEYWSPNPFEKMDKKDDSELNGEKIKTNLDKREKGETPPAKF